MEDLSSDPVHKRGSRSLPANYRPISVLSVLSSSFERAILPQLRRRLLQFIPPEQFGFVPGSGVSDAGILLADEIASTLNDREELRVVSLDLRGAFDRVWWRGLLAHLWNVGLRGRAYDLFSDYLSSRYFVVAANGVLSYRCPIHSGVPQGGIWFPLLFDLYIRELPRLIRHSSIICYADDITLFQRIPRNRRVQCATDLNTDLQCLLSYGASWLLVFEPTKTQVLTVSNRRDPSSNPPVVMDGVPVVESNLLKFLGYILDSKGLWSAHIDYVVAQSRKRVGALRRICDYLSPADLYTAYKAFVRPQLEYGHLLYWSAAEGHLARLDRVQLQAQRLFNEIPLPTLESRRAAAAVGLTCRLLSGSVSSPLLSLAPILMSSIGSLPRRSARLAVSSHPHQLLDQCDYRSLEVFKRSFRGRIPSIWNSIQSDLLTTPRPSWSSCRRLLQRLCTVYL